MKQIYHNYKKWEDYKHGLYRVVPPDEHCRYISLSIEMLSDPVKCREAMQRVVKEWPRSTEQNLTDKSINRRAWLGQSACCINHGSPADQTKECWSQITPNNQGMANHIATEVIKEWERKHILKTQRNDIKAEYGLTLFDYA